MARRRGFYAELQRQMKLQDQRARASQRTQDQRTRTAQKEHDVAARKAELAQKAAERAKKQAAQAEEAERKRAERAALDAHVNAMHAEAEKLNRELDDYYDEIDSILAATLDVDDYVDLEAFRVTVKHPPFPMEKLRNPTPPPTLLENPPAPIREETPPIKGIFGRKRKLALAEAAINAKYNSDLEKWQAEIDSIPSRNAAEQKRHTWLEKQRLERLARETAKYEKECEEREKEAALKNSELDEFIAALGYGVPEAIQEYIAIVLANSVYPDSFPVTHTAEFNPDTAELELRVTIPGPDKIRTVKSHRYVKSNDQITITQLSQKAIRDRYAAVVHAVALRTLHEVFEADRRNLIQGISLEVSTKTINPATGNEEDIQFVAVAVRRETFEELELSAVVPEATLAHLGANVSKNPAGLIPVKSSGIRGTS